MHSLKDLRAEIAAQRLSRAEDGDDFSSRSALAPDLSPVTATAFSPRAGRSFTPLTSTATLQHVATGSDSERTDDDAEEDFRESPRRQPRRRREREPDVTVNDRVQAPTVTANVEVNKQSCFPPEDDGEEGETSRFGTGSELRATSVGDIVESRGPLASTRGTPPQEKPKKMLTPLSARRARIEQQKRDEADRSVDVAGKSTPDGLSSPLSGNAAETLAPKADIENEIMVPDRGFRRGPSSLFGLMTARTSRREARGNQSPKDEHSDINGGGTKSVDLSSRDVKINSEEDAPDSEMTARVKGGGFSGDREHDADPGANALGEEDEIVRPDGRSETVEGRFEIMRSRMKKASEGQIKKSSSSGIRLKNPAGKGGWSRGRLHGKAAPGGGKSTAEENKLQDGLIAASGDSDANKAGRSLQRHRDSSGSISEDDSSALSPLATEAEGDLIDDYGSADSDKDDTGKPKNWRTAKSPPDALAVSGVDREVTLGHVVDRKMREMGYIRKPIVDKLKNRRSWRDRVAAEGAPEVHFIGELAGAEGFGSAVSCRFRVEGGRHWTCLAGFENGQTQVSDVDPGNSFTPWNHPIDLHYTTKSIQGWPRLMVQVWQLDMYGRNVLQGYGFRHLPSNPGLSEVSLPCWRPSGTMQEETAAFFLGVTPRLTAEDAVFNRAWDQRCRLVTLPAGTIWIQVNVLFRNMQDQDVDSFLRG